MLTDIFLFVKRTITDTNMNRIYICIDLKSFYASVECVARGLDPLEAKLLVADESHSDQTICLAVSPALKAIGVSSRPRLFEAKSSIKKYEKVHNSKVDYIIAVPRMAEYERVSAQVYSVYLHYVSPEDVHVYSIDECFIDCTPYLHLYEKEAVKTHKHPAYVMAMTMIREVLQKTGITATVGIGTNLYLAKVAMDIVAKKSPPDKDGVRIAELNEDSYKYLLWNHTPLSDFWQIGAGKMKKLNQAYMFTMGDIARHTTWDEEWFYKAFGIDAEILIDHAWGIEPVTMKDIKSYHSTSRSISSGQVLPRPYQFDEARNVFLEMTDSLCCDMLSKNYTSKQFGWYTGYDHKSLEHCPDYDGEIVRDFYGRLHPKHSIGTVHLHNTTNLLKELQPFIMKSFDQKTDHRLLFRRIILCAKDVVNNNGVYQLDLFTDYEQQEKENSLQLAMQNVRRKFGANAVFKGNNLLEGATRLERNGQIGGHKA